MANVAARYGTAPLLDLAKELDGGFDPAVFCDMAATLGRFSDAELAALHTDPPAIRAFFADWIDSLR